MPFEHSHRVPAAEDNSLREGSAGSSPSRLSAASLTLLNTLMAAGAAHAQSSQPPVTPAPSTNAAPAELPEVLVEGQNEGSYRPVSVASPKFTEPLRDIPQTITVVPQSVIEEQGAVSLRDVLRNVTGVSIQAGEGGVPAGDNLSIRGFNARTDLFVDGVRDFGGYTRDTFNVEQVEVTKGPSSATTGRGSTGGSVNLVTKSPRLTPFYRGSFGLGTDEYKRVTVDVNQPVAIDAIRGMAVRLNGMWNDADVPGRDEVTSERWGIAPAVVMGLGTPTRLTLAYFHLGQEGLPDYGIPWVPANTNSVLQAYSNDAPPVPFDSFYGLESRDYERTRTGIATATFEHDFNDSLRLRNLFRYGRNDRDSIITAPRFVNVNTSTVLNRNLQSRDMRDTILSDQLDLRADFDTGIITHALVTGLEFSREESENLARAQTPANATPPTDLFHPTPGDVFQGQIIHTGAATDSTADSFGIYAFDTLKIREQWELNGGLRFDNFEVDADSRAADGVLTQLGRSDTMLSWRAGTVYKPASNGSIYFGAGTSFNPSAEGLTLNAALADVEPEESFSLELGTKWDFLSERLSLSLALFRTEKTNARTPGLNPEDPPQVLDGEQVVQGVEVGVAGRITQDWQVFGGYTFLDSEVTKSNNPAELGRKVANAPDHSFSLWTTYQLPWDVEVGAGAQYVGDRNNNSTDQSRTAPGYWLLDAMVSYEATQYLTLRLNVYNLADKEYIDRLGGGHFIPGPGRSATLTANLSF